MECALEVMISAKFHVSGLAACVGKGCADPKDEIGSPPQVPRPIQADARAPLAAKDLNQQTVLHFAARSGRADTMALLLQRWCADADVTSQGSRVYGGPLDWRDRWHRTPVHWAVLNGHAEALRALLAARAAPVPPKA